MKHVQSELTAKGQELARCKEHLGMAGKKKEAYEREIETGEKFTAFYEKVNAELKRRAQSFEDQLASTIEAQELQT